MASRRSSPVSSYRWWRMGLLCAALGLLAVVWVLVRGPSPADRTEPESMVQVPVESGGTSVQLPTTAARPTPQALRKEVDAVAEELLQRFPQSPSALHVAAQHFFAMQQFGRASEIWRRCIPLAPDYAGPRVGLAMTAMENGEDRQAVTMLEEALTAGCRTAETFEQLATALQKTSEFDKAAETLRRGLQLYPYHPPLWTLLGQNQLQQEQLADAEESLQQALRLYPDSSPAHFAMATVAARLDKPDVAENHRQRFNELKEKHPLVEQPFQAVYDAVLVQKVVETLCHAGGEFQRQNHIETAEKLFRRAVELAPDSVASYHWLVELYRSQGRLRDAQLVQQRIVELEPSRIDNWVNLASICAQLGDLHAAETALFSARKVNPLAAIVHQSLTALYLERGKLQEARSWAEKAAELEPNAERYFLLANICKQLGDDLAAESAIRAAQQLSSGKAEGSAPRP